MLSSLGARSADQKGIQSRAVHGIIVVLQANIKLYEEWFICT